MIVFKSEILVENTILELMLDLEIILRGFPLIFRKYVNLFLLCSCSVSTR